MRDILKWAVGATLVTPSLETAMRVAYYDQQRYRVITTQGEFIDSSGTITKLSLKQARDKEDGEFLLKKAEALRRKLATKTDRLKAIEEEKDGVSYQISTIESEERSFDGLDEVFLNEFEEEIRTN